MFERDTDWAYRYHESMLADTTRVQAFEDALRAVIRPGDRVVDLGCGTGLLSMLALRAGAAHVDAIEALPIIEVARQLFAANGCADRVTLHNRPSKLVDLPPIADVLVSETIGNIAFDEGILGTLRDARRFVRPGGQFIPQRLSLHAALGHHPRVEEIRQVWSTSPWGIDGSAIRRSALSAPLFETNAPQVLLSEGAEVLSVDLLTHDGIDVRGEADVRVTQTGQVNCIVTWFESTLAEGVPLDNRPAGVNLASWKNGILPLAEPLELTAEAAARLSLRCARDGEVWQWALATESAGGDWEPRSSMNTLQSKFITMNRLQRSSMTLRPADPEELEVAEYILLELRNGSDFDALVTRLMERFPGTCGEAARAEAKVLGIAKALRIQTE